VVKNNSSFTAYDETNIATDWAWAQTRFPGKYVVWSTLVAYLMQTF